MPPYPAIPSPAPSLAPSQYSTGTPNFHVNRLPVAADSTWTLADWQQLLDPLYSADGGAAYRRAAARKAGRS
jgi:hypothetical protein